MMPQAWFEMTEIRRRKFASLAWMPLRAAQPICEEGNRGQTLFANCAIAPMAIATLCERLTKSEHDKGEKHG